MGSRPFSGGARELKYFLYPVITERASEHVCISKRSQDVMVSIVVCVRRYLTTFSTQVEDPNNPQNIYVWDVKTGQRKRTFRRGVGDDWPMLK